jgi:hypothetical protein
VRKKGTSDPKKSSNSGDLVSEFSSIDSNNQYLREESLCVEQSRLARDGQITGRGTGRTRGKVEEDTEYASSVRINDDG